MLKGVKNMMKSMNRFGFSQKINKIQNRSTLKTPLLNNNFLTVTDS